MKKADFTLFNKKYLRDWKLFRNFAKNIVDMKHKPNKIDDTPLDIVSDSAVAYAYTTDVQEKKCVEHRTIHFGNLIEDGITPEGYMTIEQFRKEAKASLTKILNDHGIH